MLYVNQEPCAQGELLIRKIDKLPSGLTPMKAEEGNFIVGHSETGHHHVIREQENVIVYANDNDPLSLYLVVNNPKESVELEHLRVHDTHKPYHFKDGVYHIRRQIEGSPRGYVQVAD